MSSQQVKAAIIQTRSGLNLEANLETVTAQIRAAAREGAHFIATPEMTTLLDKKPRRLFDALPDGDDSRVLDHFSAVARSHAILLLIGSAPVVLSRAPRRAANRSYLFGRDGQLLATYDKIHMFDVDLPTGESWKESSIYQPGDTALVVKTDMAKLGLSICYDVRFAALYRSLAQRGAEIITVPAAFTVPTGAAHWEVLLRARAIETGAYILAPGQGGEHEDGRKTYGHSMIIDPWGRILAQMPDNEPGFCTAMIDLSQVSQTRQRIPSLNLEMPFKNRNI